MDAYQELRNLPLQAVIFWLGERTDWKLRKDGQEFTGPCPICKPKRNKGNFSFHVDGRFRCFSCPAKGRGCIDFVMVYRQVGFQAAVDMLKPFNLQTDWTNKAAKVPSIKTVQEQPAVTENPPFVGKYDKFAVPSAWLKDRGLTEDTLKRFEVFEYNNPARRSAYTGSVMLKIRRWCDGECVGYLSRNIGDVTPEKPKYVFPKGFQKSLELFGAWQIKNEAKQLPLRVCHLVESPFCVLKFAQLGFPAVSPFGFSLSPEQVAILSQIAKGWIYLPDRNKFGDVAPFVKLLSEVCWVRTPTLPPGTEDPEHLSAEMIRALTS